MFCDDIASSVGFVFNNLPFLVHTVGFIVLYNSPMSTSEKVGLHVYCVLNWTVARL